MNREKIRKYLYGSLAAFFVLGACIILIFLLMNKEQIQTGFQTLNTILTPIIYGAILAYLLAPIYNRTRCLAEKKLPIKWKKLSSTIATLVSFFVLSLILISLFYLLIPQLIESVMGIIEALPSNVDKLQIWLETLLQDNPQWEDMIMQYYEQAVEYLENWLTRVLVPNITGIIGGLSVGVINVLVLVKNIFIGLVVMVYLLNMKDKLLVQAKMIIYSAFSLPVANKLIKEGRFIHQVFGGFIIGKLIDSLIIGILSFFCLSIMNMPYTVLMSAIIGVTNIIPFFGPFIGAVPCVILVLLVNPIQCVYFVIYILLLQQFDGNILGPKILGDSTGLPSFWVLFSILLFSGIFGFVGMIIGVPTFAVMYSLIKELVEYLLKKKKLSPNSSEYEDLSHIEEEGNTYIHIERD